MKHFRRYRGAKPAKGAQRRRKREEKSKKRPEAEPASRSKRTNLKKTNPPPPDQKINYREANSRKKEQKAPPLCGKAERRISRKKAFSRAIWRLPPR
jgi:hypothetical protein